ncbi:hypothetical protein HanXRQr2_Chr12g0563991 [Helianthus annuus]|uniref:Uncharacterized protein n=1 Tax=Helianthus annuus TaxID=4232 RepID=A0A9K3HK29_HELAN|nr:hypothetical protein HanXRQr2_Chr12g0563991 [Helianthus annuus]KAJ0864563.1 hypothetical protein HanPSC8_Chr12g0543401 [Helianthus annuus]
MSSSHKRTRVSSPVDASSSSGRSLYLDNGDCTNVCEHCGAFFGENMTQRRLFVTTLTPPNEFNITPVCSFIILSLKII